MVYDHSAYSKIHRNTVHIKDMPISSKKRPSEILNELWLAAWLPGWMDALMDDSSNYIYLALTRYYWRHILCQIH